MNWPLKPLGDIASIDRISVAPGEMRGAYIGLEHIEPDGTINTSHGIDAAELNSTKFSFNEKHVLFGKLRPYLRKVATPNFTGVCSTDILPIRPLNGLDRRFLFHYLRTPQVIELATARSTGANLPRISPLMLNTFPVPVPPIEEQKRIAAILDKADTIWRKREQAIKLADEFLRSLFLDMFGDPGSYADRFPMRRLGDVVSRLTNGYVGPTRDIYVSDGIPYLLAKHVKANLLTFDAKTYVSHSFNARNRKSILKPGDVLLVQSGHIGESAVVPPALDGANCHAMIVITPKPDLLQGVFLSRLFATERLQRAFAQIQTGITLKHLNCRDVQELLVPVPDLSLQIRFTTAVDSMQALVRKLRSGMYDLKTLNSALTQLAFSSQLPMQATTEVVTSATPVDL